MDIFFHRADEVRLPTEFDSIEVFASSYAETRRRFSGVAKPFDSGVYFFGVETKEMSGYVAASWCRVAQVSWEHREELVMADEYRLLGE